MTNDGLYTDCETCEGKGILYPEGGTCPKCEGRGIVSLADYESAVAKMIDNLWVEYFDDDDERGETEL